MNQALLALLSALTLTAPLAQDEALLHQMLDGSFAERPRRQTPPREHFKARTPRYRFDLGGDARKESFFFAKRDGTDWMFIYDWRGQEVFRRSLETLGGGSRAYRLEAHRLSPATRLFLIYFLEGKTHYRELRSTARLYLLTIERGDLSTFNMAKGPVVWEEYEDGIGHYHQRQHQVILKDLNGDGVREVVVRYHLITRVLQYQGNGQWGLKLPGSKLL